MNQLPRLGDRDSGMKIENLLDSSEFLSRRHFDQRIPDREARAIKRLQGGGFENSDQELQELVEIALEFCDADSTGISLEEADENGDLQFRWIAVAGSFARYLNGTTPRFYSPCGTCIDRGVPLHYQVTHPYYNFLGVTAEPISDGILIPWHSENIIGTLWAVSHRSEDVFDKSDYEFLRSIADLVSAKIRGRSQFESPGNIAS